MKPDKEIIQKRTKQFVLLYCLLFTLQSIGYSIGFVHEFGAHQELWRYIDPTVGAIFILLFFWSK